MPENIHSSSWIAESVSVHPSARIGPNCYLQGNIAIEAGAVLTGGIILIGDVMIGCSTVLESGVCIASRKPDEVPGTDIVRVGQRAHIGAGTILLSGVTIGHNAWIEPGTVVLRNIPQHAIVGGNPATISGYRNDQSNPNNEAASSVMNRPAAPGVRASIVQGVTVHQFSRIRDLRGDLTVGEFERNIPFIPKRYFVVYDVPSSETRGEHAHLRCQQFLICLSGTVSVVVDDGVRREEVLLDRPTVGLYIPAGIWGIQFKYSRDGTLLVFASEYYDPEDYIRSYDEFLRFRGVDT